ncbi:MAG: HU family DNA-binding protein [Burkholderiales bacterium]|jgi:DNA-binding protein HU-beta|nr:HU family DNA-binding protein [Burkholderiales bacterium]MBP9768530.1 HU family DNA-binding protein [Burkholderiales bacterium]MBX9867216.1 HU family DNA-binding protein [Burkholderiales bacterium]HCY39060.1 DNA-binding protein HU [Neisseriales bacterium]
MNKAELIDAIASGADISKVKAGEVIDAFVSTVTSALKNGDTVTLVGFGSFTTAERAARTGRNPATGEEIQIAASTSPKFKPGKQLKDAVAKK